MPEYPPLQQIVGVVGRDPEVKNTGKGDIVKFSLAVTRQYDREVEGATQWVDVAVFNTELQPRVLEQVYKGAKVAVEGNLKDREVNGKTYTDMVAMRVGLVAWISKTGATMVKSDAGDDTDF